MLQSDHFHSFVRQRKRLIINLTPLIDVLFLLLIFLMVNTTFIKYVGLKVSLPQVKGPVLIEQTNAIEVVVAKNQDILINGSPIRFEQLEEKIKSILSTEQRTKPTIHFSVDEGVAYGFAVKVMGLLKSAGAERLFAMTTWDSKNREREQERGHL